ncbi:hypothetical protein N7490_007075 [Penicillium lividum]|nr:hypothetical protein N7490_007075 [Penicillium lividum]
MSTPSSSRGPGPDLGSQITATVVKFRCMFTHDLRRKSKRWQDGFLQYHTFNKRGMVYDEQGNYIGDYHWRSAEEVQEGDEFELDKGVLVEVGERMSTKQTDLSNLYEKRRSSQTSPKSRDNHPGLDSQPPRSSTSTSISTHTPTHTSHTPTPVRSSLNPFRSLNDLLGIRKIPIGYRASPYEERHGLPAAATTPQPERPTKRARTSTGTTTGVEPDVVDLTEPENGLLQCTPVRDTPPSKDARPMPPPGNPKSAAAARLRPDPPAPIPIQPAPARPAHHTPITGRAEDKHAEQPSAQNQQKDTTPAVPDDIPHEKPAVHRISMQKPRNKFMYSAIQQPSPVPPTSADNLKRQPLSNSASQSTRPASMRNAMSVAPEEPEVREEGPWTAEAMDLFDYWPPGRPKPV